MTVDGERNTSESLVRRTKLEPVARSGHVTSIIGTVVRTVVPDVRIGDLCRIERDPAPLLAEVVGFDRTDVLLMPLGPLAGVGVKAAVQPIGATARVPVGESVRGRVIDARGNPLDGRGPIVGDETAPLLRPPPNPLKRARITEAVSTGVRAIDGLLTVGRGQRVGIFAAAGVGKSTLLSMLARNVRADRVVLALIGERGREVVSFIEDNLGEAGMRNATVVVSTSDEPAMMRMRAAYCATAIAEAPRARGEHVVLMMDSVTRFARALREIGLATGEPPGRQGFPASVYAALPTLFERAGNDEKGSITAFYAVLVAGDDLEEPVADETISLLDGHIVLSRKMAERGQLPAIDVLKSKSRLMRELVDDAHLAAAGYVGHVLSTYEQNYDKIALGLYDPVSEDERTLVGRIGDVWSFMAQRPDSGEDLAMTVARLRDEFGVDGGGRAGR